MLRSWHAILFSVMCFCSLPTTQSQLLPLVSPSGVQPLAFSCPPALGARHNANPLWNANLPLVCKRLSFAKSRVTFRTHSKSCITSALSSPGQDQQTSATQLLEADHSLEFITLFRDDVQKTNRESMYTGALKVQRENQTFEMDFAWAKFGTRTNLSVPIALANPITAEKDLENSKELAGKLVVVKRGGNSFTEKCERIAACGAAGVVIVNTDEELLVASASQDASPFSIPIMSVRESSFDLFQKAQGLTASLEWTDASVSLDSVAANHKEMPCVAIPVPLLPGEQTEITTPSSSFERIQARSNNSFVVCYRRGNGPMSAIGTAVRVVEVTDAGSSMSRVVLQGTDRVRIVGWSNETDSGVVAPYEDSESADSVEVLRSFKQVFSRVADAASAIGDDDDKELIKEVLASDDATEAALLACRLLPLKDRQRQLILQTRSPSLRLSALTYVLSRTAARYARTEDRRQSSTELQVGDPRRSFVADVSRAVLPAMVKLRPKLLRNTTTQGSGFIVSADGTLVTNAHVASLSVGVEATLSNGTKCSAKVLHRDKDWDIAILQLESDQDASFPTVPLGDSDWVERGDWAIAMGNPSDQDNVVTMGIITGFKKDPSALLDMSNDYLLTDALVSPGMSGGPLLSAQGEVMGVNTFIRSDMQGMGFCLAINRVRDILSLLRAQSRHSGAEHAGTQGDVWLYNDRFNTKQRVAAMLAQIFEMGPEESERVMMEAHRSGRALVGTWNKEEAEEYAKQLAEADILAECTPTLPMASEGD